MTNPQRPPRILVIDDDPAIPALVASLDTTWQIVVAANGLCALDLLEQRAYDDQPFDLVLLDIEMPGLDGFDTCLQIRALDRRVPILPLTRHHHHALLQRYASEGLCELPVDKESMPMLLKRRIVQALHATVAARPVDDAVWERLQHKSRVAKHAAQQQRALMRCLAIFGRTVVQQVGLHHVLATVEHVSIDAVVVSQELLLSQVRVTPHALHLVVSHGVDAHEALAASRAVGLPLLVVVSSVAEGQGVLAALENDADSAPATGVVIVGETIPPTLAVAVATLIEGRCFRDVGLSRTEANDVLALVRQSEVFAELSSRQAELVALDLLGWKAHEIAAALSLRPKTIATYWKRICERLGMERNEVQAWARRRLTTMSPMSPELSPLASPTEDSKTA